MSCAVGKPGRDLIFLFICGSAKRRLEGAGNHGDRSATPPHHNVVSFVPKRNILRPRPQVTLLPLSRLRLLPCSILVGWTP